MDVVCVTQREIYLLIQGKFEGGGLPVAPQTEVGTFFERFFENIFFSNFNLIMVPDHNTCKRKKTPKLAVLGHKSENLTCFEDFQLFEKWYVFSMKIVKAILLSSLMTYFCSFIFTETTLSR